MVDHFPAPVTGCSAPAAPLVRRHNPQGAIASRIGRLSLLAAFLLNYAGLTWEHVQDVLLQELGAGNVAAVEKVAEWVKNYDMTDPNAIINFLRDNASKIAGLDPADLVDSLVGKATAEIGVAVAKAVPQLIAKFVPGAGQIFTAVRGLQWLAANRSQLQDLFNILVNDGITALTTFDAAGVQSALYRGLKASIQPALSFLAGQVGLAHLPQDVQKVVSYVPRKVDKALRDAIDGVAGSLRGGTKSGKSDSLLGGRLPKEFAYAGKTYELWETKESEKVFVKVGVKGAGQPTVLKDKDFAVSAKAHFGAVDGKAKGLAGAAKKPAAGQPPPQNAFAQMAQVQKDLAAAEDQLITDMKAGKCTALDGGCFAAGTKLWTPAGYRKIEEIQVGDLVFSRDEHNPAGAVEAKAVEQIFVRLTAVWHLHVGGQVIRTSGEHPFNAHGKGWTAVKNLTNEDWVLTDTGDWKQVEEVWNTGELEVVYNLRVADHHTYFVGDDGWGWAAWAHNQYFYHGTTKAGADNILNIGINSAYFEPRKDFGKGFYTTTILQQAVALAAKKKGSVLKFNVPDNILAGLTQLNFGAANTVEWQNTVTQGRRGLLDVTPHPLGVDVVSGILLRNVPAAEADPLLAEGDGQQTVWLTQNSWVVLQTIKPVRLGG